MCSHDRCCCHLASRNAKHRLRCIAPRSLEEPESSLHSHDCCIITPGFYSLALPVLSPDHCCHRHWQQLLCLTPENSLNCRRPPQSQDSGAMEMILPGSNLITPCHDVLNCHYHGCQTSLPEPNLAVQDLWSPCVKLQTQKCITVARPSAFAVSTSIPRSLQVLSVIIKFPAHSAGQPVVTKFSM